MGISLPLLSFIVCLVAPSLQVSMATDTITLSQSIIDRNTTSIVSQYGKFEFGFFSPGNSKSRYLGIWYKNIPIQTMVWVANRLNPLNDASGILTINSAGSLILTQNYSVVWHTNPLKKAQITSPVVLQLLDSGNLVVREETEVNPEHYLWQSFDYPTDTLLPGMKFGWDLRIGLNRHLTAWKSPDDPSPGDLSMEIVLSNDPESYMMKGRKKLYRSGPWNGIQASGEPVVRSKPYSDDPTVVQNKDEVYVVHNLLNNSEIFRIVLNQTTNLVSNYKWSEFEKKWKIFTSIPVDNCDNYNVCGAHGGCIITEVPMCQCLKGFKPRSPQAWNSIDWSLGCVREKPLSCTEGSKDGFMRFENLKLPETTYTLVDETIGLEECRAKCLKNCSCMAYTNKYIKGTGSGCVMWFGDLIDLRQLSSGGQYLFIRMADSELEVQRNQRKLKIMLATTIAAVITGMLLLGCFYIYRIRKNKSGENN